MRLESKVALITGGAQGVGAACVRRFVQEGAMVTIADVQPEKADALVDELGPDVAFVKTDVSQEDDFSVAIEQTIKTFGQLDVLVNNAAVVLPAASVQDTTNQEFNRLMEVNIRGVFLGCKLAYPHLKRSKGCVVNISSMAGVSGQADHAVYGATKGAVNALTKCTAADWGQDGIRINAICPAGVLTEATFHWLKNHPEPDAAQKNLDGIHQLNRCAQPEEIAAATAYLASDDASFMTGAIVPVSGGSECGYNM